MRRDKYLAVVCAGLALLAFCPAGQAADFHVATTGRDTNPGTLQRPFATIVRARDEVRKLIAAGLKEDVSVLIHGGTYTLTEPVVFGLQDSGTAEHTITYTAYREEEPVFSSGVKITGWQKLQNPPPELPAVARDKVWVADVPKPLGRFYCLFDAKGRLPRAVSDGFVPAGAPGEFRDRNPESLRNLNFPPGEIKNWSNLDDVEVVIRPAIPWTMNILALESVDEANHVARTSLPASAPLRPLGSVTPLDFWKRLKSAWVENVLEVLNKPGEWVLNTHTRKLYLWPRGEKPDDTIVAPALKELIRVEGAIDVQGPVDKPVRGLVFKGLTFKHADRILWVKGDKGMQHDWEMEDKADALVRFRGAENCAVEYCKFTDSGGNAIRLDYYAQANRIVGNEIRDLGQGGIVLFGYGPGTKDVNKGNDILNNDIHNIGLIYWHSHGIIMWQSGNNHVANNYIHEVPRKAICVSGARYPYFGRPSDNREVASTFRWFEIGQPGMPYDESLRFLHARNNLIENNEVAHALQMLGDGAAINVSGAGEGNIVRHNYLHDIFGAEPSTAVLRNDDWQRGSVWAENVVVRSNVLFGENKGASDIVNNIAIDMESMRFPTGFLQTLAQLPIDGARFEKNIFVYTKGTTGFFTFYPPGTVGFEIFSKVKWDNNLYYDARPDKTPVPKFLQDMRAKGVALTDSYGDPMFMDPQHDDFRLKPDSPARKMGIQSIDLSNVGLTKDFPKRLLQ